MGRARPLSSSRRYASVVADDILPEDEPAPLRERMPVYLRLFAAGLAGAVLIGLALGFLTGAGAVSGIGYTFIGVGTLLLLVGGARGGGYSNIGLGAVEAIVGGRNRSSDDYEHNEALRRGAVHQRRDPRERLRKGLRPPPNPSAFWQSVAGFVFIGLGVFLTLSFV
jgi:hypothetical protein